MRKYGKALVVGKFCPLHKGHQHLLDAALLNSKELMIISYTSRDLGYPASVRRKWLKELYPTAKVVVLEPNEVPADDASEWEHRRFCARRCDAERFDPDVVFSSEKYGDGFAEHLTEYMGHFVAHQVVDLNREAVPISGTILREQNGSWEQFVHPFVAKDRPVGKRILFIGGESSGKTTLTKLLGEITGYPVVAEYGRELFEELGVLKYEHMLQIGLEQVRREDEAAKTAPYVFCDTSPLVTKFYSQDWYEGRADPMLKDLSARAYDKIYVCVRDFEFVDDGTRNGANFSDRQHMFYVGHLQMMGMPYETLTGPVAERAIQVLKGYRK